MSEGIYENVTSWVTDPMNLFETSLYDYYCEARAVSEMENSVSNESPHEYEDRYLLPQLFFKQAKVDMSLLLRSSVNNVHLDLDIDSSYDSVLDYLKHNNPLLKKTILNEFLSRLRRLYLRDLNKIDVLKLFIENPLKLTILIHEGVESYLNSDYSDYNSLKKIISNTDGLVYYQDKKKSRGCFAIMKCENEGFFSFSGFLDYHGPNKRITGFSKIKESRQKAIINLATNFAQKTNYIWARLKDDTRKYVDYNQALVFLDQPQMLKYENLCVSVKDLSSILGLYSCCERKLLLCGENKKCNKDFYIRWVPCEKCIPALMDYQGLKYIYAYSNNYDDLIKHNFKGELKLRMEFR